VARIEVCGTAAEDYVGAAMTILADVASLYSSLERFSAAGCSFGLTRADGRLAFATVFERPAGFWFAFQREDPRGEWIGREVTSVEPRAVAAASGLARGTLPTIVKLLVPSFPAWGLTDLEDSKTGPIEEISGERLRTVTAVHPQTKSTYCFWIDGQNLVRRMRIDMSVRGRPAAQTTEFRYLRTSFEDLATERKRISSLVDDLVDEFANSR